MGRALAAGAAGVVGKAEEVDPALKAVAAGLVVRGRFSHTELGISHTDAIALSLRSRSHAYSDIGMVVGYSDRQVRRRLQAMALDFGLTRPEMFAIGRVLVSGDETLDPTASRTLL